MAPARSGTGYWGPVTSLVDWCEENYVVTSYIAEFWNTLSNLLIIVPAIIFAYQAKKVGLERRYFWILIAFLFVGIGSWLFHMTLLYEMQITDELPMVFGSCFFIYTLWEVCKPIGKTNVTLAAGLTLYSFVAFVIYILVKDPVFFQVVYGLTVVVTIIRALYNIKYLNPCRQVKSVYFYSFLTFLTAFILWNLDQQYCSRLKSFRDSLKGPMVILSPLTQLHAWWHIIIALATYQLIAFNCIARQLYLGRRCSWSYCMGVFPYLEFGHLGKFGYPLIEL